MGVRVGVGNREIRQCQAKPFQRISEQNLIEINTKCNLIRPFAAHTHTHTRIVPHMHCIL